ncbi:PucR family transcriptional regulator [Streptomyces marispadix]|uniref:Helix-turn-helix domain-containing protein n=1 Tax=Streptomyces marispadix TaxID=2922868 RepID=A0ABS9SX29_9ACTN|nr:helix-turn-helix domain-containing protein [Streptomyces marispadix]MCH6160834.1 helix-turn-helix domain-containing protein [Streptomyces marispadix]
MPEISGLPARVTAPAPRCAVDDGRDRRAESLARRLLAEPLVQRHFADRLSLTVAVDDMTLWLTVARGRVPATALRSRFKQRFDVHRAAGLSAEESLLLHRAYVRTLTRDRSPATSSQPMTHALRRGMEAAAAASVAAHGGAAGGVGGGGVGGTVGTGREASRTSNDRVYDGSYDTARSHDTAHDTAHDAAHDKALDTAHERADDRAHGSHDRVHERPLSHPPLAPSPPSLSSGVRHPAPRWCLAVILAADGEREALRRFRGANPDALITVTGTHVCVFTRERPRSPEVLGTYALVVVEDGDTSRAARRAALAAVVARHYGAPFDTRQGLPLIAALDMPPDDRAAFVKACLGPLVTDSSCRHLLDTLAAFLAHNLCVTATARSMYVHRHTCTYRLRAIRKLTGLDPYKPFDRMRAEFALILSRADSPWTTPRRRGA